MQTTDEVDLTERDQARLSVGSPTADHRVPDRLSRATGSPAYMRRQQRSTVRDDLPSSREDTRGGFAAAAAPGRSPGGPQPTRNTQREPRSTEFAAVQGTSRREMVRLTTPEVVQLQQVNSSQRAQGASAVPGSTRANSVGNRAISGETRANSGETRAISGENRAISGQQVASSAGSTGNPAQMPSAAQPAAMTPGAMHRRAGNPAQMPSAAQPAAAGTRESARAVPPARLSPEQSAIMFAAATALDPMAAGAAMTRSAGFAAAPGNETGAGGTAAAPEASRTTLAATPAHSDNETPSAAGMSREAVLNMDELPMRRSADTPLDPGARDVMEAPSVYPMARGEGSKRVKTGNATARTPAAGPPKALSSSAAPAAAAAAQVGSGGGSGGTSSFAKETSVLQQEVGGGQLTGTAELTMNGIPVGELTLDLRRT